MKYPCLTILVGLLFVSACSSRSASSHPEINAAPLVVIAHDAKGNLKDFRIIKDLGAVRSITVTPAEGGQEIYVTVLGTQRDEHFRTDTCVGTKDAEGYRGTINVVIQNGMAGSATGDMVLTPSPLTRGALDTIASTMAAGQLLPDNKSLITIGL